MFDKKWVNVAPNTARLRVPGGWLMFVGEFRPKELAFEKEDLLPLKGSLAFVPEQNGGDLTADEVEVFSRNLGVDPTCGACMEIGYTGVTLAGHTCKGAPNMIAWKALPSSTEPGELPPDAEFVLLTGPSGVTTTPAFVVVGRRHEEFRPRLDDGRIRWLTIGNDALSDSESWAPTHWATLPLFP